MGGAISSLDYCRYPHHAYQSLSTWSGRHRCGLPFSNYLLGYVRRADSYAWAPTVGREEAQSRPTHGIHLDATARGR